MITFILLSQILIQFIFQYAHSIEGYIVLFIAFAFCVAIAEARWCALWAKYDYLDMRLKKLEKQKKGGHDVGQR